MELAVEPERGRGNINYIHARVGVAFCIMNIKQAAFLLYLTGTNINRLHTTSVSDKYLKKCNRFFLLWIALSKLFVLACISSIDSGRNLAAL